MPGKVNPVIPEAVSQVAMLVMGHDQTIALAASSGSLELNPFLPLVAHCLLESCEFLAHACDILRRHCVEGIEADEKRCLAHVHNSTVAATALVPAIGYERACNIVEIAHETGRSIKEVALSEGILTEERFNELVSPEAVSRLGSSAPHAGKGNGSTHSEGS
jgi:aspartate ammonia-lyase